MAGARTLTLAVPPDGATVRTLLEALARARPGLAPLLRHSRYFHDERPVVSGRERVRPGEELAVHPPYTGG